MAPTEAKVKAATGGSIIGTALAGAIVWFLDAVVFKAGPVPDPVVVFVWVLVPAGLTLAGGYLARHTPRPAASATGERLVLGAHRTGSNVRKVVGGYSGTRDAADVPPPQHLPREPGEHHRP